MNGGWARALPRLDYCLTTVASLELLSEGAHVIIENCPVDPERNRDLFVSLSNCEQVYDPKFAQVEHEGLCSPCSEGRVPQPRYHLACKAMRNVDPSGVNRPDSLNKFR